jgi:hypothetical protein
MEGILHMRRTRGKLLGSELRTKRAYTNPYFLQKMVESCNIDPLGTCFDKDVFDPRGLNPADYYDKYGPNHPRPTGRFLTVLVKAGLCFYLLWHVL